LQTKIHRLSKPELEFFKNTCNFSDEELKIIEFLRNEKSHEEISTATNCSVPTVARKIRKIRDKMERSKEMEKQNKDVPIWEKLNLTADEASKYSGIGINKIYEMMKSPACTFTLFVGRRTLIKRKEFEKYLADVDEV
jgi:excisionase family DNA binding protein